MFSFPFIYSTVRYRTLNCSTIGGFRYGRRIWDCLVVIFTRNLLRRFTLLQHRVQALINARKKLLPIVFETDSLNYFGNLLRDHPQMMSSKNCKYSLPSPQALNFSSPYNFWSLFDWPSLFLSHPNQKVEVDLPDESFVELRRSLKKLFHREHEKLEIFKGNTNFPNCRACDETTFFGSIVIQHILHQYC